MSIDAKTREVIYKFQNQQKISIYMAVFSPFGLIVFGILTILFLNDVFDSIVPIFVIGGIIMLYFFRKFVGVKKYDYQDLPIYKKMIALRKYIRGEK